jgi:hypothetical protein
VQFAAQGKYALRIGYGRLDDPNWIVMAISSAYETINIPDRGSDTTKEIRLSPAHILFSRRGGLEDPFEEMLHGLLLARNRS